MSVWATIIISISGSFITGGFLLALHWLNKKTEQIKATENFRLEIFKKQFSVYQKLNQLLFDILYLSISAKIQSKYKAEQTKASICLRKFVASNSIILSSEIGKMIDIILAQEEDPELVRKTFNAITKQIESELHLEKTVEINENLFTQNKKI